MNCRLCNYIFYVGLCLLAALAAAGAAGDIAAVYQSLPKPPLAPPDWLFPLVWTLLYVLLGYAAARVRLTGRRLTLFWLQLAVNLLWPVLFFRCGLYCFSYGWLLLLLLLVIVMVWRWFDYDKAAAWLQLPYVIWLVFASYLNLGVCLLQ